MIPEILCKMKKGKYFLEYAFVKRLMPGGRVSVLSNVGKSGEGMLRRYTDYHSPS